MKDSLFKLFSSVRLVQEVSRSTSSPATNDLDNSNNTTSSLVSPGNVSMYPTTTNIISTLIPIVKSGRTCRSTNLQSQNGGNGRRASKFNSVRRNRQPSLSRTLPKILNNSGRSSNNSSVIWRQSTPPSLSILSSTSQQDESTSRLPSRKNDMNNNTAGTKSKSQKLLCLWPLPTMTRYTILLSVLISALNACQLIHLTCSSPKYVLFRHEVINLLLSPFLFNFTLHGLVLFGWNVLILGLFEESLAQPLGGTRRFCQVVSSIVLAVCTIRQGIGYLFSKSTGWALPTLFFSDSIHECNQGLAPFLFALLIIQSVSIDDKYILIFGEDEDSNYKLTIRKVTLQLIMLLVNYTVKNILWWSLTGLLTGYLATIVIQATYLPREDDGFYMLTHTSEDQEQGSTSSFYGELNEKTSSWNGLLDPYRRTPLWRILWTAIKRGTVVMMITLPLLLLCNAYYTQEHFVDELTLNNALSKDPYLFSFVIMTAPRRDDPPFLTQTLQSYMDQWPLLPPSPSSLSSMVKAPSLYDRLQVIVYTHFSNHSEYDRAYDYFSQDPKGQRYIKWIREEGNVWNHRLHISSALRHATSNASSTYVALLEDDFPICGRHAWREIENIIYEANQQIPNHCGVFVGTGGR
ncbi:uncharacterized protein BX664DRAFT_262031 [Halteromyces radiatus]|uniref:uncharacterized protein n=1 Tax=Halteromyces radiatus TaxID=101107 RepID=UPI00221F9DCA|nr:uncharacterized protein BX664DRAFT_262031 [Halteromyces radiatus]KAI8089431.1 hypothetical protein BX664DRAFT_262031 [Halteromyces radiatus]